MLFRSSVLVICLLGCAVVQGKNPLRDTRDMDEDMTLEEAISSYDAMESEIVSLIPACEDFLESWKNNALSAVEYDPDLTQSVISLLQAGTSMFSAYLEQYFLTAGRSHLEFYCYL